MNEEKKMPEMADEEPEQVTGGRHPCALNVGTTVDCLALNKAKPAVGEVIATGPGSEP